MHFQMVYLLGLLQNLNKVCLLKLFFFYDPANVGHPVNLSYNSIHEELSRTRTRLIDLFIGAEMGAESGFISQTNQFATIDHVKPISFQLLITWFWNY